MTEDPNEPGARVYEFTARFGDLGYGAYGNALSSTGELRGRFVAR